MSARPPPDPGDELVELREQLREAVETLEAIRQGGIDAVIIGPPGQQQVFVLEAADHAFRLLVESMSEGAATISAAGVVLYANDRLGQMIGQPATKLAGWHVTDLVGEADRPRWSQLLDSALDGIARAEVDLLVTGGDTIPVQLAVSTFHLDGTSVRCLVATDLTARKQAERELAAAARYTRDLIEATLDPLVAVDPAGNVTDVNREMEVLTGGSRDQLIGTPLSRLLTPADRAEEAVRLVLSGTAVRDYDLVARRLDGAETPVSANANTYPSPAGGVGGVLVALRDMTERNRIQQALGQLAAIVEASDDPIETISPAGTILSWNPGAERLYGYSVQEALGASIQLIVPEDGREHFADVLRRVGRGQRISPFVARRQHKDGRLLDVSLSLAPIRDGAGAVLAVSSIAHDVTAEVATERALAAAASYNRRLFEASLDPLVTIGPDGTITDANHAAVKVTGVPRGLLVGSDLASYFTEPDRAQAAFAAVFERESIAGSALTMRHAEGGFTEVLLNASLYAGSDGRIVGAVIAARDVTERTLAQRTLEERERQLSTIYRSVSDAVCYLEVEPGWRLRVVSANDALPELCGKEGEAGRYVDELFPEPIRSRLQRQARYAVAAQRPVRWDDELALSAGVRYVEITLTPLVDTGARSTHLVGTMHDLTERKEAEQAASAAQSRFKASVDTLLDPFALLSAVRDDAGEIVDFVWEYRNKAACATDSETDEPVLGRRLLDTHPGHRGSGLFAEYQRLVNTGEPLHKEAYWSGHVDGDQEVARHFDISATKVDDGIAVTWRDVSERARMIEALRESEERFRATFERAAIGIAHVGLDGRFLRFNQRFRAIVGYPQEELLELGIQDITHPGDLGADLARAGDLAAGRIDSYSMDRRYLHKEGGEVWVRLTASIVRSATGEPRYLIAAVEDISARKRMEQEILALNRGLEDRVRLRTAELERANQNLEAFAYSVSHDLRAPLRALNGFSQVLIEDFGDRLDETGREYARRIQAASDRMANLIDDLLALSRVGRASMQFEQVDLSAEAAEVVGELRRAEPDRVVEVVIQPAIRALADRRLIRAVLENLVGNAWKFTSRRDAATIEFGEARADDGGAYYYVRDNGAGFDAAYIHKLFQPFQRLHASGEFAGTGIGLASVRRIVERHGGRTWAEGAVDRGATFCFTLNAEAEAPAARTGLLPLDPRGTRADGGGEEAGADTEAWS